MDGSTRVAKIFVNGSDRGVYVELQAKFPSGKNVWPAIWMVAERDGWPPEIDIWEHFGTFFDPDASWGGFDKMFMRYIHAGDDPQKRVSRLFLVAVWARLLWAQPVP